MPLRAHLATCEQDTRRIIGNRAANALSYWRSRQADDDLVHFVKNLIRSPAGQRNGWKIDQNGGVSLEAIVLDHEPDLFSQKDKEIAARTLGRELALA